MSLAALATVWVITDRRDDRIVTVLPGTIHEVDIRAVISKMFPLAAIEKDLEATLWSPGPARAVELDDGRQVHANAYDRARSVRIKTV